MNWNKSDSTPIEDIKRAEELMKNNTGRTMLPPSLEIQGDKWEQILIERMKDERKTLSQCWDDLRKATRWVDFVWWTLNIIKRILKALTRITRRLI